MQLEPKDIRSFHQALLNSTSQCLGYEVKVLPSPQAWWLVSEGTRVEFELYSDQSMARAKRKDSVSWVLQLPLPRDRNIPLWVGWREEWICMAEEQLFALRGVSWTFYWGHGLDPDAKEELFRAEWDGAEKNTGVTRKKKQGGAAQPHWHFDRERLGDIYTSHDSRADFSNQDEEDLLEPALVPLESPIGLQEFKLSPFHLAMGGCWENLMRNRECWQHPLDRRILAHWAATTLVYSKDQLERWQSKQSPPLYVTPD